MEVEPPKAEPPKRKRRWFQFSLRSLLIVVVIVAIPCAWLGWKIDQKRRECEAVAAIIKAGGIVVYDYQKPSRKVRTNLQAGRRAKWPCPGLRTLAWREVLRRAFCRLPHNSTIEDDETLNFCAAIHRLQDLESLVAT